MLRIPVYKGLPSYASVASKCKVRAHRPQGFMSLWWYSQSNAEATVVTIASESKKNVRAKWFSVTCAEPFLRLVIIYVIGNTCCINIRQRALRVCL